MRVLVILLGIILSTDLFAKDLDWTKPEKVGMSTEKLSHIKPFMQKNVDEGRLAGIVTLIARRGKIVHFEKVGNLDIETGKDIQFDSLFRIYSMTKPIVSVALMTLYEEGKFQLDDPVHRYMPEFSNTKVLVNGKEVAQTYPFTIRNLLTHTAGMTYGIFGDTEVDQQYRDAKILRTKDLKDMVERLSKIPLQYQPGTRWHYSVSVDVIGRLIEVLSGQTLDVFLKERMFQPLGMEDTFFQVPENKRDRFGTNHERDKETGRLKVVDRPAGGRFDGKVTFFSGGGGLVSTAMDYLRFSQMLLNGGVLKGARIISRKTIELMTTNHLPEGMASGFGERPRMASVFGFGLGFGIAATQPVNNLGSVGEYSWGGAAGTLFWIDPVEELVAVLMVQMMRNPVPLRAEFKTLTYSAIVD